MKDNLEKYIEQNRAGFDSEIPNLKLWATIEKNLNKEVEQPKAIQRPRKKIWKLMRIASAVLLLLLAGAMGGSYFTNKMNQNQQASLPLEFVELKGFYEGQINQGISQLTALEYDDKEVLTDLKQLEEVYEELNKELENNPTKSKEQIMEAMIENYRSRAAILELVLERIKKNYSNDSKEKNYGKSI